MLLFVVFDKERKLKQNKEKSVRNHLVLVYLFILYDGGGQINLRVPQ